MARTLHMLVLGFCVASASVAAAQGDAKLPTSAEVKALLKSEPINDANWPAWRQRLISWFGDRSRQTDEAYKEAARYVGARAGNNRGLPARLERDHIAWYMLANHYLDRQPTRPEDLASAERAFRQSVAIEGEFARGRRNIAMALILQVKPFQARGKGLTPSGDDPRLAQAEKQLAETARLDPNLDLDGYHGMIAEKRGNFPAAIRRFEDALRKDPENVGWAVQIAHCILLDPHATGRTARIQPLVQRFPKDGVMSTLYALSLAMDNRPRDAYDQLERARSLGADPTKILPPDIIRLIEGAGKPSLTELYLRIMAWFGSVYAGVMLSMAGVGLVLAVRTRGTGALGLLQQQTPTELVQEGRIARVHGETVLARMYGFALMVGLVLFYAAIPFVILGLLGGTAVLLYLIFTGLDRIPIKLIVIIVVAGGFSAWAVFKSLFTRPASGAFGIRKTGAQCPQLHQLLAEVARKVDTDPVDEVYLAPGAAIGVHQEGRGPFGMFGINKRVLTLGFCTLRFLTVGELKAILAHEYAHFSHSDTFYSRFIYQVHMSIEEALYGMAGAGGWITYVNPFYWFLWLYYKSYSLLAAGYSRSREYLADRMAATLYGAAPFTSGLTKVSTDGTLFEMTMYDHIAALLNEQKEFTNMYDAFARYRNEQITQEDREKLYKNILGEQGSLFASHPTFAEREAAIQTFPAVVEADDRPAMALFDDPGEIESELTRFLTEYLAYIRYLQAQAEQQQT